MDFFILFFPLLFTIGECLKCSKSVKLVKCLETFHGLVSNKTLHQIRASQQYKQIQKDTYKCFISENQDSTPVECGKNDVACQRNILTLEDNSTFEISNCSSSTPKCDNNLLIYLEDAMGKLIKTRQCGTCTKDLCKATDLSEYALGLACYNTKIEDCDKNVRPGKLVNLESLSNKYDQVFHCLNTNYRRYRCEPGTSECITTIHIYDKTKRKLVLTRCANQTGEISKSELNILLSWYVGEEALHTEYIFCNTSLCNNSTMETLAKNGPFICYTTDIFKCLAKNFVFIAQNETFQCLVDMVHEETIFRACKMGYQCWRVTITFNNYGSFQHLGCGLGPKEQCEEDIKGQRLNLLMNDKPIINCEYCKKDLCNDFTKISTAFPFDGNIDCYKSSWKSCDKYKFDVNNSTTDLKTAQANMYKCLKSMKETEATCNVCVTRIFIFKDDKLVTRGCNTTCDKMEQKNYFELFTGKTLIDMKCPTCKLDFCNKATNSEKKTLKAKTNNSRQLSSILALISTILFNALEIF